MAVSLEHPSTSATSRSDQGANGHPHAVFSQPAHFEQAGLQRLELFLKKMPYVAVCGHCDDLSTLNQIFPVT